MPIANVKVYLDGSHPIAIPPQANSPPKRKGNQKQYLATIALPISEDKNTTLINDKVATYIKDRTENGDKEKFVTVDLKEIFDDL